MNPTYSKLMILDADEKLRIETQLKNQFGIKSIPGNLIKRGQERIFLYQGDTTEEELKKLEELVPIERMGVYFAKEQNEEVRLSIEGVHILKDQISKRILELNKEQAEDWMMGQELDISSDERGFVIMKYEDNFLGCGKASEKKITNFIPKNRRLKIKSY